MTLIKTSKQLEALRESGSIHNAVMTHLSSLIQPGITTQALDDEARVMILSYGAKPSFLGFEGYKYSLCTSINEQIVHTLPSKRVLKDGDLLKIDLGVLFKGMHSDAGRTFAVGKISSEAKLLKERTKNSFFEGVSEIREGAKLAFIGKRISDYLRPFRYGVVRDLIGHGVGSSLHEPPEVPNYYRPSEKMILKEGMVLAIEPMVNIGTENIIQGNDGWTISTADGSLSAYYEDTVIITKEGYEIVT